MCDQDIYRSQPPADYFVDVDVDEGEDDLPAEFDAIIDEPHFYVVKADGIVTAEVHTPVDLTDLGFWLAQEGYAIEELIAFHDGVIEMLLRELGDIPVNDPVMAKRLEYIKEIAEEKEVAYA